MVLRAQKYVAAGVKRKKSLDTNSTQLAVNISKAIVKYFWKDLDSAENIYRKVGTDQTDPGDLISREDLKSCLKSFTQL
jgi:hypothetical protein